MEAAFVLGVIFGFIVVLVKVDARKKERMFLMKQGKDPNLADSKNDTFSSVNYLKWGIIVASIGLGMLAGTFIGQALPGRYDSLYIACLLIFGGIGIIVGFLVARRHGASDKSPKIDYQ
jgi:uncharacterized membrane-anchored protein YhcB (DUF1043 family)